LAIPSGAAFAIIEGIWWRGALFALLWWGHPVSSIQFLGNGAHGVCEDHPEKLTDLSVGKSLEECEKKTYLSQPLIQRGTIVVQYT
jgi:hypothetical protein